MYIHSNFVRTSLLRLFDDISKQLIMEVNASDHPRNKAFAYRTNSLITVPDCIRLMTTMHSSDIYAEIVNSRLFDAAKQPSVASYIRVRDMIPVHLFEGIFQKFTDTFYWKGLASSDLCGFRFYGVDGSTLSFPYNAKFDYPDYLVKSGRGKNATPHNEMHINGCFDLNQRKFVDCLIQPGHQKDERDALLTFIDRISTRFEGNWEARIHSVFVDDRGYESWGLISRAQYREVCILCRAKSPSSNGLLSGIRHLLPDDKPTFDVDIRLTLTRRQDKAHKDKKYYKFLNNNQRCDECTPEHDYCVEFRVCKVQLGDGTYEYLITTLPRAIFPLEVLKTAYFWRWRIETGYKFLKKAIGLEAVHAEKVEAIIKEVWSKMTFFNYVSECAYHNHPGRIKKEDSGRKHDAQICFSDAVADARLYLLLPNKDAKYDLCAILDKHLSPVRDERSFERNKNPRTPVAYGHRPT